MSTVQTHPDKRILMSMSMSNLSISMDLALVTFGGHRDVELLMKVMRILYTV